MKLSRKYKGKEVLCKECKTKEFKSFLGFTKEEFGFLPIHKKGCKHIKALLKENEDTKIPILQSCPEHGFRKGYILCGWCNRNRERAVRYVRKLNIR